MDDEELNILPPSNSRNGGGGGVIGRSAGLFKKGRSSKRNATTNANAKATTNGNGASDDHKESHTTRDHAAVKSKSAKSRSGASSRSSAALSFDLDAELSSELASQGSEAAAALRAREEREKRKKEKRRKALEQAKKEMEKGGGGMQQQGSVGPPPSGQSYSPEALAALRNNAVHFSQHSAASRPPAHTATNNHLSAPSSSFDPLQDPEVAVNAAALHPSAVSSPLSALGTPLPPTSFRRSGRDKQMALQEEDDMKSMVRRGTTMTKQEERDAAKREEELDRLAEQRMVRAARLKRERMRAMGITNASDDTAFAPSSSAAVISHAGEGRLVSGSVELDRSYGDAVMDSEEDEHSRNLRLVREDADDLMQAEYDDDDDGEVQLVDGSSGRRIRFGDPTASQRKEKGRVGALLDKAAPSAKAIARKRAALKAGQAGTRMMPLTISDDEEVDGGMDDEELEGGAEMMDDDETRAWEEELIRKGAGKTKLPPETSRRGARNSRADAASTSSAAAPLSLAEQIASTTASVSARSSTAVGAIDPIDVFHLSLKTQLESMENAHSKLNDRFHRIQTSLHDETATLSKLEMEFERKNDEYVFYQQLSERLLSSLDCLAEKKVDIDAAVREFDHLHKTHRQQIDRLCDEHVNEMWMESCFASSNRAREKREREESQQVDEFGRDLSRPKQMERERRKEMRIEWFKRQLAGHTTTAHTPAPSSSSRTPPPHPLGCLSLTDLVPSSSPDLLAAHSNEVRSLLADSRLIFSDTSREFRTLTALTSWLEGWKRTQPATYFEAFIPDCIPTMMTPYVELEIMQRWNPIEHPHFSEPYPKATSRMKNNANAADDEDVDEESWYSKLFTYGMNAGASGSDAPPSDDDSHLIPRLVDSIILPKVRSTILHQMDPFNLKHVQNIRSCMQEAEAHIIDDPHVNKQLGSDSVNGNGGKATAISPNYQAAQTALKQRYEAHMEDARSKYENVPDIEPQVAATLLMGGVGGSNSTQRQRRRSSSSPASSSPDEQMALRNQLAFCSFRFYQSLTLFRSLLILTPVWSGGESEMKSVAGKHMVSSLLPFLAWMSALADEMITQASATSGMNLPPPRSSLQQSSVPPSSLVTAQSSASSSTSSLPPADSSLRDLQAMSIHMLEAFPKQWISQDSMPPPGSMAAAIQQHQQSSSSSASSPMTQLYQTLLAMQQASERQASKNDMHTTVKQLRRVLKQ